jgi:NosR/NirI family transcriptional regulator, nitrous oxide reductase regulator
MSLTTHATQSKVEIQRGTKTRRTHWLVIGTILLLLSAWLFGYFRSSHDLAPLVLSVIPGADRVERRGGLYIGYRNGESQPVGYAAVGSAQGYGGPIEVLVSLAPDQTVIGMRIVSQHETPGFFRLVTNGGLVDSFIGLKASDSLKLGQDLDAISGATYSAEGVAEAARRAIDTAAKDGLNITPPERPNPIQFGFPEIALISLYVAGYFGHRLRGSTWKRRIRWGTLLSGMVVLGFIYTAPFTIAQVIALLSGYWPDWHNNLYWYLLIGGILFVTTVDAKNPYCSWFCPFGAFQECLSVITGARHYRPRRYAKALIWVQRGLALAAILFGLFLRQPGVAGYEPFATLFDLRGSPVEWIFLVGVILASLILYRPFCNYLCPLAPVVDFIAELRRNLLEIWKQWQIHLARQ